MLTPSPVDQKRRDQVSSPVSRSVIKDGTRVLTLSGCNPVRDQEYQSDGTNPVIPGVLVNGITGFIMSPWLFW